MSPLPLSFLPLPSSASTLPSPPFRLLPPADGSPPKAQEARPLSASRRPLWRAPNEQGREERRRHLLKLLGHRQGRVKGKKKKKKRKGRMFCWQASVLLRKGEGGRRWLSCSLGFSLYVMYP
jgi:hypothetical protein